MFFRSFLFFRLPSLTLTIHPPLHHTSFISYGTSYSLSSSKRYRCAPSLAGSTPPLLAATVRALSMAFHGAASLCRPSCWPCARSSWPSMLLPLCTLSMTSKVLPVCLLSDQPPALKLPHGWKPVVLSHHL